MELYKIVLTKFNGKPKVYKIVAENQEIAIKQALLGYPDAKVEETHILNNEEVIKFYEERITNCRAYIDSKMDMLLKQRVALNEYQGYAKAIEKDPRLNMYRISGTVEESGVVRRRRVAYEANVKLLFKKEFPTAVDIKVKELSVTHQIEEIQKLIARIEINIEEKIQRLIKHNVQLRTHMDFNILLKS